MSPNPSKQCQGLSTFCAVGTSRSNSTCYVTRDPAKGDNKRLQPKRAAAAATENTSYSAGTHESQPVQLDSVVHCLSCGYGRHKPREQCPARGNRCAACKALNHFVRGCFKMGNAVRAQDTRAVPNSDRGSVRAVTVNDGCSGVPAADDACYIEVEDEFDLSQYGARIN